MVGVDKSVIYTINISIFLSKATSANSLLLMRSILWVVNKASAVEYLFFSSSSFINHMSTLEKIRKSIPKTTFILVSANKKVSSKNQIFPSLSLTKNPAIIIP